ncbi:unnamed protein product [Sphagnum troendelagicum]|uniref:Uncharacterized protein n=2 Tax=Sphagnum jensenii TaxID=128206 RepID=A0ABP1A3A4_9BRYO
MKTMDDEDEDDIQLQCIGSSCNVVVLQEPGDMIEDMTEEAQMRKTEEEEANALLLFICTSFMRFAFTAS